MSDNRGSNPRARGGRGGTRGFEGGGRGSGGRGGGGGRGGSGGGGGGFGGPPRGGFRGGAPGPGSAPLIFSPNTPTQIDPRLSSEEQNRLIAGFKQLSVKHELPLRPGYGTKGRPITLRANFFAVKVPKTTIFDYNVEITPKTDINRLKARIFQLLELNPHYAPHVGYTAHDRSERLVSARKLPQPLDIQLTFCEEGQQQPSPGATIYTVAIVFTRELDTGNLTNYLSGGPNFAAYDPLPLISALNLVLQHQPARTGIRVGNSRYFFPSAPGTSPPELGLGLEAWRGFFVSLRPAYKQLMVNVNVCMTPFYIGGNLADALRAFNRQSVGGMLTLPKGFGKGLRVTTRHLGYPAKKPLFAIGSTSARRTFFPCEELGGRVSVEQYFQRKYRINLKYPDDLPVVNIGNEKRPNYVPAELCEIHAGQPFRGKLNDRETASMIRHACKPPGVNADAIVNQGLQTLALTPGTRTAPVNGFGITINVEMEVIPARELPPPTLAYKSGRPNVKDGSWNILDVTFQRGASVASWWVLVVEDGKVEFTGPTDPKLSGLVKGFTAKCAKSGMKVPTALPSLFIAKLPSMNRDPSRTQAIDSIRQAVRTQLTKAKNVKPSFILVLLSGRDNYIYPGIKRLGDVELGVHTVHMLLPNALKDARKQDQYFSNIALKVNTKLGGINHLLDATAMEWLTVKKTMIVGMDVTHPGPTSRLGTPSIATVVASVDDSFVQYPASLRIQEGKKEMVQELKDMMVERLLLYEKKNKVLPDRIFVYRDGVSEGQFNSVLDEELPQMLESFKKFNTQKRKVVYRPKLSIVICGKRHHARFYPTDSASADRNGNTRPGTVVDKGVTAVYEFDFYLQAHAGLQGTVRPTHYTVVYDENSLGADEVQQGTNTASYLYGRATKAVSLVPPAYYADLACERGRCYLNDLMNVDDQTSTSGGAKGKRDKDEEKARVLRSARDMWGQGLHPDLRDSMFYI